MIKVNQRRGIPFAGRVLVTGGRGFLGKHIIPELEARWKFADIIDIQGSSFFDLTQPNHVNTMFKSIETNHGPIKTVIHLAALSGGMFSNSESPASYFYQNMMMGLNMLEACASRNHITKLVTFMGACSFPDQKDRTTPFTEEDMWDGLPAESSLGYSFAKKAMLVGAWAYEKQFGLKTLILMPSNLIGEYDNFSTNSHVVPALIEKFVEAVEENYSTVTIKGTGKAIRDWVYAGDVAKLLPDLIKYYDEVGKPLSISSGVGVSIAEIVELVAKATGFTGKILYDSNYPDGQLYKVMSNEKLTRLLADNNVEFKFTSVEAAISKTVEWFRQRIWKK